MTSVKTLLHEHNPISLFTAVVQENGDLTSLILMSPKTAIPAVRNYNSSHTVTLYRHKKSMFSELLYVFGVGPTHEGVSQQLSERFATHSSAGNHGMFKKWFRQTAYRYFLVSHRRGVRSIIFKKPPELKLLWADSGHSVALFINRDPWAFIHEEKNHGYSKGILKATVGNPWDQALFEKTFC